ncbi:MAG: WD40 repeat domain-containing protein, partial [Chloroflexota bacterium]
IILDSTEGAIAQETLVAAIEIQRQQSDALRLASEAENALENEDPLAIPLAIAAERAVQNAAAPERIGRILAEAAFKPGLVRFFETEDERTAHDNVVSALAFSPDGTQMATASHDRTVRLWNTQSGELIITLEGHSGRVLSADFSRDGALLATGDANNVILVWDVGNGQVQKRLEGHNGRINDVAFAPDGSQLVSVSSDTQVFVWNMQTGERIRSLGNHGSRVTKVAYNPDGTTFITGDANGLIFVWDAATSFFQRREERHAGAITGIAYSEDGGLALTTSLDGRFILWRDFDNEERRVDDSLSGMALNGVAFATEDTALIATENGNLLVWDLTVEAGEDGELRQLQLPGQTSPVTAVATTQSRRFAAVAYENRRVALWEVENGAIIQRVKVQELPISNLATGTDARIVFRYVDGLIGIWEPDRTLTTVSEGELGLAGTVVMPGGASLLGQPGDGQQPVRYNLNARTIEQTYDLDVLAAGTVFSPDGSLAFSRALPGGEVPPGSPDGGVADRVLWDVATGDVRLMLPATGAAIAESPSQAAISADNTRLAVVRDVTDIQVFDIESGVLVNTYSRDRAVTSLAFGPAGGLLVGYADGGLALRRVEDGTWRDLRGHTEAVLAVTTSPDKQFILSGSQDGSIVVWNIEFTEAIRQFETDTRGISGIVFDNENGTFVTRSVDGSVLLWRFDRDVEAIIEWTLENRFVPSFSQADCVAFQIPEPCG